MANVELNYYNGSIYEVLYPKIAWTNNSGGTIATANIPNLDASKITSGTFSADRIPTLNANKITTGTFGGSKGTEYIFPGNLRIGGSSSSSDAYLRIGDSDYVHLHEDADDMLTIKAKRINFLTTNNPGLTNNGVALGGGGCQITRGSYIGTGASSRSLTLPTSFLPKFFIMQNLYSNRTFFQSTLISTYNNNRPFIYWFNEPYVSLYFPTGLTYSSSGITLVIDNSDSGMNVNGVTYNWVAAG